MRPVKKYASVLLVLVSLASSAPLQAQTYPVKPVRMVIPYAPGGGADTTGRLFAQKYGELWKEQVVVDNRGGAGGNIGADAVAKSTADGHTILFTTNALSISAALYRKLPFDPLRDLAPVTQLTAAVLFVATSSKLPAANLKELIALAKAQPGKLNYGTTGVGGTSHFAGAMFASSAGINIVMVPYKGDALSMPALISGDIHIVFAPMAAVAPHVATGRVRLLAVSANARVKKVPDIPTVAEAGLPDYEYSGWLGLFAPAGTPRDIQARISNDGARIVSVPEMEKRLSDSGLEVAGSSPEQFAIRYRADIEKFRRTMQVAGIPPEE